MFKHISSKAVRLGTAAIIGLGLATTLPAPKAMASSQPFIGELMLFGGNYCPRGWANADGQLLAINSNQALFSLFGTMYGGDGRTTFGLPDLRGRVPQHVGNGPGLQVTGNQGTKSGADTHTLSVNEMPSHNHMVNANNGQNGFADRRGPADDFLGSPNFNDPTDPHEDLMIYSDQAPNVQMDSRMISNTGGSQSFSIRNPYQVIRWCVSLQGVFPPRS